MRWLIPLLLLAACDGSEATEPAVDAGATLGPDPCEAPLMLSAEAPLDGRFAGDRLEATCTIGVGLGDAIAHFVAPSAGRWVFSAEGASVSLRPGCASTEGQRACDVGQATAVLDEGDLLYVLVEGPAGEGFTLAARPVAGPELSAARLHVNPDFQSFGVVAEGNVADEAVTSLGLTLLDDAGEELVFEGVENPLVVPFDHVRPLEGTRFEASVSTFVSDVSIIGGARVFVVDAEQRKSASVDVAAQSPGVAGARCDWRRAIDACGAGLFCTASGCESLGDACPPAWGVEVLSDAPDWRVREDTSGAAPLSHASCGGGSPSRVYLFTPPLNGTYAIEVTSDGHPDPLLYVRSRCGTSDIAAELACNDDAGPGDLLHSRARLELSEGRPIWIFVDGYSGEGSIGGGFELQVRAVTAPEVEAGEAFINRPGRALGVRVSGTDAEEDLSFAWLQFVDEAGEAIEIEGSTDAFAIGFSHLEQSDGRFTAEVSGEFLPGFGAFDDFAAVRMALVDSAELVSGAVEIQLGAAPELGPGAICDVLEGFGRCPEGEACANLGAPRAQAICQPPVTECPESWPTTELSLGVTQGDTTSPAHGGLGTCGGGGPKAIYRFTPPSSGRYRFEITEAAVDADPLLYLRTHCGFARSAFEVGCNDDADETNFWPRLDAQLEGGTPVFLFVDAYDSASVGPFTLEASSL